MWKDNKSTGVGLAGVLQTWDIANICQSLGQGYVGSVGWLDVKLDFYHSG